MRIYQDYHGRSIRFTDERYDHIESDHPEMKGQDDKIQEALLGPDSVRRSKTDSEAELFYKLYASTPVTRKYLCIVVKASTKDAFVITAYFTDTIKQGEILWPKK